MLEREDVAGIFAGAQQFDSPPRTRKPAERRQRGTEREERDSEAARPRPPKVDDDRWSDAGTFTGRGRDDDDDSDAQDIHAPRSVCASISAGSWA